MAKIRPEIEKYAQEQIMPLYDSYDSAHRRDHIEAVINRSLTLAEHYDVDVEMVYVIALYHDLGICRGREQHHITSGQMLLDDARLREWFDRQQLLVMRDAVEDHRASSDHTPRTIYGMIVAEADRQISPEVTLLRTVQYGLGHYPQATREEHFARFVKHLRSKYAEGGYMKLWIPYSDNAARLTELRALIADSDTLRSRFDAIYNSLTDNSRQ